MKRPMKMVTALALALGTGLGGVALAEGVGKQDDDTVEFKALMAAPVTLTQAITAAETATGGRAMSAEFEDEDDTWLYEVELVSSDGTQFEAHVDATSGAILAHDDDGDAQGDKD